jgi:hypothetical protein
MNERIRELAKQATNVVEGWSDEHGTTRYYEFNQEKFAELIVRECAGIAIGLSKLYPREDVGFDVGYTMGAKRAAKEIAEHFGVEE